MIHYVSVSRRGIRRTMIPSNVLRKGLDVMHRNAETLIACKMRVYVVSENGNQKWEFLVESCDVEIGP